MTRHKVIFDVGHYLNTKQKKIDTNNTMNQRLNKIKIKLNRKRFGAQTRTLTQNGPDAQKTLSRT